MKHAPISTLTQHLVDRGPDHPVLFFAPERLHHSARVFQQGFPGLTTYAVKANSDPGVLENLVTAGLHAFDVASPAEMEAVRAAHPKAALHYNNPVRSEAEIAAARAYGIASASVDDLRGLMTIAPLGCEIAVRFKLPVKGAAYDFGSKFGATPEEAEMLLHRAADLGLPLAMTFHPGTQCTDPEAWAVYIQTAARIAARAGVRLDRLNVGGGFPAHRYGQAPDLHRFFTRIGDAVGQAFGADAPALVCEPGRAMVADAFALATRIKAVRDTGAIFLNDGIYGGLSELRDIGPSDRIRILSPQGLRRQGAAEPHMVFGPTCDSLDHLPQPLALPGDATEGDYVIFDGMGAYSLSIATRFNGYGLGAPVAVTAL
ncbi:type III PLP-dependent enzyme [Pseudooceanicola nitratireducens]|uniref:type III PLP-dependent enzyme n=1 Tax=Pseudooceanicola nitratireducens TaxID=517719 RepID=UPI001C93AF6C|nr:type III PLP-dependent enzyme [Pseudooceanicola nitratireducens]MBY6166374.1 type III PLP-dependent enzyme [Pseudooceanicola nitratireducens]